MFDFIFTNFSVIANSKYLMDIMSNTKKSGIASSPIVELMPKMASAILNPRNHMKKTFSERRVVGVVFLSSIGIYIRPVSLFPTPGGPDIARTSGSTLPDFLRNSHPAIALVMVSSALF